MAEAPFADQSWLIYACSPHNYQRPGSAPEPIPRCDEWFELHRPLADATRPYPYLRFLESQPIVWMRDVEAIPWIKGAKPYPEAELKERFGLFFFTSSIAYILAKAIVDCEEQNIPAIGIWGVMQASETEYRYQRPGIQHMIWEANRLGIKVMAPEPSRLFEPPEDMW